jgi:hypothetical protein
MYIYIFYIKRHWGNTQLIDFGQCQLYVSETVFRRIYRQLKGNNVTAVNFRETVSREIIRAKSGINRKLFIYGCVDRVDFELFISRRVVIDIKTSSNI